jgi:integrase
VPFVPQNCVDLLAWFQQRCIAIPMTTSSQLTAAGREEPRKATIMVVNNHAPLIQPVVRRLGIKKRVTWHTFRRTNTTLLHPNGEDVKVVQELLRHGSSQITMDVYAQAQRPEKRAAPQKVVEMINHSAHISLRRKAF